MKKKQFMSKLAALTMAAAMGLTVAPSTVFAQTVAVEQSEAAVTEAMLTLKQGDTKIDTNTTDAGQKALYDALAASAKSKEDKKIGALDNADATKWTEALIKKAVEGAAPNGQTITVTNVTGATVNSAGATVTFDYSDSKTYTLTIDIVSTKDLTELSETSATTAGQDLADAIDDYFSNEDNAFKTYAGQTLNSATVLNAYKNQANDENTGIGKAVTAATSLADVTPTISAFSVNGEDFTATLTWTTATVVYNYSFSGTVSSSSKSTGAIVDAAVTALQANPIADKGTAVADVTYIQALLNEALKDDGITVALSQTTNNSHPVYTAAKHGTNGTITVFVDKATNPNAAVTFTLKESSTAKLDEADKKLASYASGATTIQGTTTSSASTGILGTAGNQVYLTDADDNLILNDAGSAASDGKIYTIASTSKLSRSIQARNATVPATADAVKDAVQSAVETAVADYAGDGVTYTTEVVANKYDALSDAPTDTTDEGWKKTSSDATVDATGWYLVKVTASVANDWYRSDAKSTDSDYATAKDATSKNVYYVLVQTGTLGETKSTGVTLADSSYVYKADTKFNADDSSNNAFTVSIKPTLMPADANSKVEWEITKATPADSTKKIAKDSDYKIDATTYGTDAAKLVVKEPGTYVIKATTKNVSATATITVKDTFADAPSTAYFYTAVKDAYAGGVTNGVSATSFGAGQNVTRAQFVTFLYNYAKAVDPSVEIKDADVKQVFSDVPTTAYYAKAVQWAYENKITSGTGDGKFSPNAEISRAQAVTFIYNAKNKPDTGATGSSVEKTIQFTDVKKGSYYEAAVTWGVNNDVVYGLSTTSFGPDNTATRAQAITFIARAYGSDTDKVFSNPTKY
jgi:hypothetical protein